MLTGDSFLNATNGMVFSHVVMATRSPTSFGAEDLPAGFMINSQTGEITGTPGQTGTVRSTLLVTTSSGVTSIPLTFFLWEASGTPPLDVGNPSGGEITFTWPTAADGFILQSTTDIGNPESWQDVMSSSTDESGASTLTVQTTGSLLFFRLIQNPSS